MNSLLSQQKKIQYPGKLFSVGSYSRFSHFSSSPSPSPSSSPSSSFRKIPVNRKSHLLLPPLREHSLGGDYEKMSEGLKTSMAAIPPIFEENFQLMLHHNLGMDYITSNIPKDKSSPIILLLGKDSLTSLAKMEIYNTSEIENFYHNPDYDLTVFVYNGENLSNSPSLYQCLDQQQKLRQFKHLDRNTHIFSMLALLSMSRERDLRDYELTYFIPWIIWSRNLRFTKKGREKNFEGSDSLYRRYISYLNRKKIFPKGRIHFLWVPILPLVPEENIIPRKKEKEEIERND